MNPTVARKEEKELSPHPPPYIPNTTTPIPSRTTFEFKPQTKSKKAKHTFTNDTTPISSSNSHTNDNHNKPQPILSLITPSPPSDIDASVTATANSSSLCNGSLRHSNSRNDTHSCSTQQNTEFNINFVPSQHPLIASSEHFNSLISKFGHPQTMADFNIMSIAGVLSEGNHIHKNRELKSTIKRFTQQMTEKDKDIRELNENVKVYKDEAEKYERLLIKYNELKDLNANLLSHNKESKKESAKLKRRIKEQENVILFNGRSEDKELLTPLEIEDNNNDINEVEMIGNNDKMEGNEEVNDNDEVRKPSQWLKNQRLIQLTGDQTYMTAHQKVIRDPSQKKQHQSYQRKDTFKSLQNENESLKEQIVRLTQIKSGNGSQSEDGLNADYLKQQLSKVRCELEEEKRISAACTAIVNSDDDMERIKRKYAANCSEYERLKKRYSASKQRVENLAQEKEAERQLKDEAMKARDEVKERAKALLETAKNNVLNVSNEKEMMNKQLHRMHKENKKLMERESEETQLKQEIKKLEKKLKDAKRQSDKYKKKYKDGKVLDLDGMNESDGRKTRKKHKKRNKIRVSVSSDSSDKGKISETVKLIKKWDKTETKNMKNMKNKKKQKNKKNKKEKAILDDIENAMNETKNGNGKILIGNHFKINGDLNEASEDDDINWSDDEEDQMIITKTTRNDNKKNVNTMDIMSYASKHTNMQPIHDAMFDANDDIFNYKDDDDENRIDFDTNANTNNNMRNIQHDDEGQSEEEFIDHNLLNANDVFKTRSTQNVDSVELKGGCDNDRSDIDDGILTGITSPLQNPVSRGLNATNPFITNANINRNNNDIKPQPLFGGFEGGTSDSSAADLDHSDIAHFDSPMVACEPDVFVPLKIDDDDAFDISANTHSFNDKNNNGVVLKLEALSDDDHDINHKKRARCDDGYLNINEPLNKKRKLNDDDDDDIDDFDTFMDEDDDTTFNNANINIDNDEIPTAPPMTTALLTETDTNTIDPIVNINPFENKSNTNIHIKNEETDTNEDRTNMKSEDIDVDDDEISANEREFTDWKAEFVYLITLGSVDYDISNIVSEWKGVEVKDIASNILDLLINRAFTTLCPSSTSNALDFFAVSNSCHYLSLLRGLGDILCKFGSFFDNLIFEIMKKCRKLVNGDLLKCGGGQHYLVCGLLSILCSSSPSSGEGFFWRSLFFILRSFSVSECAVMFSIMFECYPSQIVSHGESFVINCFRYVLLNNNNIRLIAVIGSSWNYIVVNDRDEVMRKQLNLSIECGANDAVIFDETQSGVLMLCECDIGYGVNHFLPNILYPIIYEQFTYHKPKLHVFLLDLYYESVNRIYKRLKTKCTNCDIDTVRNDIVMMLDSILTLSIGCAHCATTDIVEPMVALCCIRNLSKMKSNNYIQNTIAHNIHSDHQLLQFATNIFRAWNIRMSKLSSETHSKQERHKFNALIHIISNVFKKKAYNIEAYLLLKKQYSKQ